MIPIIRGLVRPFTTTFGFVVFSYLTYKYPEVLVQSYVTAVTLMLGYWYGSRQNGKPPNGTPT